MKYFVLSEVHSSRVKYTRLECTFRLEFAAAILARPDWLLLDEATCHLPTEDQIQLLQSLKFETYSRI